MWGNIKKDGEVVLILPHEKAVNQESITFREGSYSIDKKNNIPYAANNFETFREPLGIESIAAYLRMHGYRVKMFFCDIEELADEDIIEYIKTSDISFVGFSVLFDRHLLHALMLSLKVSKLDIPVFMGGAFISFTSSIVIESVPWIDGIIIGEGEETCRQLVDSICSGKDFKSIKGMCCRGEDGKALKTPPADKLDLKKIPPPDRDFLNVARKNNIKFNMSSIYTSRGCPEACVFCTGNRFSELNKGKLWRSRDVSDIVNEVEYLHKNYDISYFYICDDNFVGYGKEIKERLIGIVEGILEKGINAKFHCECRVDAIDTELLQILKKGGFVDILLGIEAGSQTMLERWKKRVTVEQNRNAILEVRNNGLNLKPGYILFDEMTTFEELCQNIEFIKDSNLNTPQFIFDLFNPMQVFKGSELEKTSYPNQHEFKVIEHTEDAVYEFVRNLCVTNYEVRDNRVRVFWEAVGPIVDNLNFLINYKIIPELFSKKKSIKDIEKLSGFLKRYKSFHNDIGEIIMDVVLHAVNRVNNGQDGMGLKEEINGYYGGIEKRYFQKGLKTEFEMF